MCAVQLQIRIHAYICARCGLDLYAIYAQPDGRLLWRLFTVSWRLVRGEMDSELSIVLLNLHESSCEIEGIVRLDLAASNT